MAFTPLRIDFDKLSISGTNTKVQPFKLAMRQSAVGKKLKFANTRVSKQQARVDRKHRRRSILHIQPSSTSEHGLTPAATSVKGRPSPSTPENGLTPADTTGPVTPASKTDRKARLRTLPFDEERDLDPWLLFPRLQRPYSALKNNSIEYYRQAAEAKKAEQEDARIKGSPLSVAQLKDMAQWTLGVGKYLSPSKRQVVKEDMIDDILGSPMDLSW